MPTLVGATCYSTATNVEVETFLIASKECENALSHLCECFCWRQPQLLVPPKTPVVCGMLHSLNGITGLGSAKKYFSFRFRVLTRPVVLNLR